MLHIAPPSTCARVCTEFCLLLGYAGAAAGQDAVSSFSNATVSMSLPLTLTGSAASGSVNYSSGGSLAPTGASGSSRPAGVLDRQKREIPPFNLDREPNPELPNGVLGRRLEILALNLRKPPDPRLLCRTPASPVESLLVEALPLLRCPSFCEYVQPGRE
jgi:hypothetical protein